MKKIDNRFRHLTEHDAVIATDDLRLREAAPEAEKAYLKADDNGPKQAREKVIEKSRRSFLGLMAGSGISAGLIRTSALLGGLMANRHALAQVGVNKRVIFCYLNSGAAPGTWMPTSSSQMAGCTKAYGPEGENVAGLCNFRQVDVEYDGHSNPRGSCFGIGTGEAQGTDTMDNYLAGFMGIDTPKKQIYLGATTGGQNINNKLPVTSNPSTALADVFTKTVGTADTTYIKSFDAQLRAFDSIKAKLSATEFLRYQEHIESINKLKKQITDATNTPLATCSSKPASVSAADHVATGLSQADIIVAAFACGITRVATLQLGDAQGAWKAAGHGYTGYTGGDHHNAAHSVGDNKVPYTEMGAHASMVPAYLIKKLTTTMGPDGQPLINTTVFVQTTCMGNGMNHSRGDAPFIVATKMAGFKQGFSTARGGTSGNVIASIAQGLGYTSNLKATPGLGLV